MCKVENGFDSGFKQGKVGIDQVNKTPVFQVSSPFSWPAVSVKQTPQQLQVSLRIWHQVPGMPLRS